MAAVRWRDRPDSEPVRAQDMIAETSVWIFNGPKRFPGFPSAVFLNLELGEQWVRKNSATGTLTCYPVNTGVYEWAVANTPFKPKTDKQKEPEFIESFTSAYTGHYHYESGINKAATTSNTASETEHLALEKLNFVWIFNGPKRFPGFPSAVFLDLELGEQWVRKNSATGTFTRYPVNTGVYEWAVAHGFFVPRGDEQREPAFIESFSSTYQEQFHYYRGHLAAG